MTSTSAMIPNQSPAFCGRLGVATPTATAAIPATNAPTSPTRTTVTLIPTSHDHEIAHKTRARIPRLRDDCRTIVSLCTPCPFDGVSGRECSLNADGTGALNGFLTGLAPITHLGLEPLRSKVVHVFAARPP